MGMLLACDLIKDPDIKPGTGSNSSDLKIPVGEWVILYAQYNKMEENEDVWKKVKGSQKVPIVGPPLNIQPKSFEINVKKLIDDFKIGYENWKEIWQKIINPRSWETITDLVSKEGTEFHFKTECWARILYDLAAAFHHWKGNRQLLVSLMTPLYFARVASFVNHTRDMTNEEAEAVVEEQAVMFEQNKPYLIERWDAKTEY